MKNSSQRKNQKKRQRKNNSPLNYALKLLSLRDYSKFEIKKRLERKNFDGEEIEKTLDKLVELGLLSDERYIKRIIEKYAFIKRYGYLKVQYELLRRGIEYRVFSPILEEQYPPEKEKENAFFLSNKRPIEKLERYLTGRGYRNTVIKEVLAELKEDRR